VDDVAVNFALRQILIRRGSSGLQAQTPDVSTLSQAGDETIGRVLNVFGSFSRLQSVFSFC